MSTKYVKINKTGKCGILKGWNFRTDIHNYGTSHNEKSVVEYAQVEYSVECNGRISTRHNRFKLENITMITEKEYDDYLHELKKSIYEIININGKDEEIDKGCVDMVRFFNNEGLTTQFCCEGHSDCESFEIIFDESVTEKDISDFLIRHAKVSNLQMVNFSKWTRLWYGHFPEIQEEDIVVHSNWMFSIDGLSLDKTKRLVKELYRDLMKFKKENSK